VSALTGFLLARIADEERRLDAPDWVSVESVRDGWGSRGPCPLCDAYLSDGTEVATEAGWYDHAEHAHRRRFVLAECEAKRRIIETITEHDRLGYDYAGPILELLALPYADHPDYDSAWRV